jgi:hypothetical protein
MDELEGWRMDVGIGPMDKFAALEVGEVMEVTAREAKIISKHRRGLALFREKGGNLRIFEVKKLAEADAATVAKSVDDAVMKQMMRMEYATLGVLTNRLKTVDPEEVKKSVRRLIMAMKLEGFSTRHKYNKTTVQHVAIPGSMPDWLRSTP